MNRAVEVIGVPMDLGADRRGVDMGPSAIRYGGLDAALTRADRECHDTGDLTVPRPETHDPNTERLGGPAKYLPETRTVCKRLTQRVTAVRERGHVPLVLGGDHSIGIGTANGVADGETGVLWFDAHGDFNTPETTPSGNIHGMTLAAILGKGPFDGIEWAHTPAVSESNVVLVGLRDLDAGERRIIKESDVTAYTMSDIDDRGASVVVREAIERATDGVDHLYVSLDMDVLDPDEAPGVGTPVQGGLSYREAHAAMELLYAEAGEDFCAFELVEVNPILDRHNRTAELGCELLASAFGEQIL